jgi:hypothetical protein
MDDAETRELVWLRHELRRLRAEGRREEAQPLLDRLRSLGSRDEKEAQNVGSELLRWRWSFGLA